MKIVVTGATSFVGLGAVRELLHRGHQVYAVLREHSTKADLLRENGKFPQGLTIWRRIWGISRNCRNGFRADAMCFSIWAGAVQGVIHGKMSQSRRRACRTR